MEGVLQGEQGRAGAALGSCRVVQAPCAGAAPLWESHLPVPCRLSLSWLHARAPGAAMQQRSPSSTERPSAGMSSKGRSQGQSLQMEKTNTSCFVFVLTLLLGSWDPSSSAIKTLGVTK